jgi:hypothetical protein
MTLRWWPTDPGKQLVEIARSFSFKVNAERYDPRLKYESRDFFCSQKAECRMEDADRVSDALHTFCKSQVMKAVNEYIAEGEALSRAERLAVNERKVQLQNMKLDKVQQQTESRRMEKNGAH